MTSDRYDKINDVLAKRQTDLTLLLEEVHKPHNVSAVYRSADAVGVHTIHAVWRQHQGLRSSTAMGSQVWVNTHVHDTLPNAIEHLHEQKMQILVTHLDENAVDFREIDYTLPTAILLGQEKTGATKQAIALADHSIIVPMVGMVQSLNVSVAAALILYEAQRQRQTAGMYNNSLITKQDAQEMLFAGGFPLIHRECIRRNLPFPRIDENGCIQASEQWWDTLQFT